MKLREIASSDELTRSIVNEVLKKSPLLADHIQFFSKPGNAITVRSGGDIDGVVGTTRALGSDYAPKTVEPTYATGGRKFMGDKIRIDMALERMGFDISSEMTAQLKRRAAEFGLMFNHQLIKGDPATDAKQFAGMAHLVNASRTVKAGVNGMSLTLGNSDNAKVAQQTFLEKIDDTVSQCDGLNKVIIANARVLSRLNAVAREYITITKNEFGVPIAYYNQIPLINIGDYLKQTSTGEEKFKAECKPILDFDETCGTSKLCSSLYVASFEEENGLSFATTQGGFTVYPIQKVANFLETTMELIVDSMLIRPSALSKLEGLML